MAINQNSEGPYGYYINFNANIMGDLSVTCVGFPSGTEEQMDEVFQSLVNHLATWDQVNSVAGGKNHNISYAITPDPS